MGNESLLEAFANHCIEEQASLPFVFNVLDEQCGHIVENSHTNLLMKLLQYKNQYGYTFLKSFFTFINMGIDLDEDKPVSFCREKFYTGIDKKGRIDGLIFQKDNFALIIENKVNGAGNQPEQLKKYIEGVLADSDIFDPVNETDNKNKIWVVFLTREGVEDPDADSWKHMKECGICDATDDIQGPRYAAINYQDHILPWLKEIIQPIVMQKEQVLNTGILQYVDFLEGMLGVRQADKVLLSNNNIAWLTEWLKKKCTRKFW